MTNFRIALGTASVCAALSFGIFLPNFAYAAQATLSTSRWDLTYDTTQLTDAGWAVEVSSFGLGQGPPSMDVLISAITGASPTFGAADLSFNFKTERRPQYDEFTGLPTAFEIVTTPTPEIISFTTRFSSIAPANAQFATSFGQETLTVLANGAEQATAARLFIASAGGFSTLGGPSGGTWASAPTSPNGSWNIRLEHSLIGSNHLVPSQDPGCVSVLCMPAVRATVQLNSLLITIPFQSVVVPMVPEPETYALMLSGFAMIGWITRRRLRRS